VRTGNVSLVQNSRKYPQCPSEVRGDNSCEILPLKVSNKPLLAPVQFTAFFGVMVRNLEHKPRVLAWEKIPWHLDSPIPIFMTLGSI